MSSEADHGWHLEIIHRFVKTIHYTVQDPINYYYVIIFICSLVVISFVFNYLSAKANIPSVILLIAAGFGVRLSPYFADVTQIMDLRTTLNILGVIGLIMIVLEASIDLHLSRDKLTVILRSFAISLILLVVTSGAIAYIINWTTDIDFNHGLLYGIPLSVMSSAIIIPSVANLDEKKKEFMIYESTFSDILGIIMFYMLLDAFRLGDVAKSITHNSFNLLFTAVISIVVTFALAFLFQRLFKQINYFLIFAMLMLIYAVGKIFHLSALILILVFGIIVNNKNIFFRGFLRKAIDDSTYDDLLSNIKLFTGQTAFLVRTFFFFIFGMSISPDAFFNMEVYAITFLILVALYAIRFVSLSLFFRESIIQKLFIAPRGLITILLLFSIPQHLASEQFQEDTAFMVIIFTNLIMMLAFGVKGEKMEESPNLTERAP